jgi:hypothetical protein
MGFQHICGFCGWRRLSASPVMLSPACGGCGCALSSSVAVDPAPVRPRTFVVPAAALAAVKPLCVLLALLVLYAAAKVGWHAAGPSGGLIAFGAGGFLLLPFVPQRLS